VECDAACTFPLCTTELSSTSKCTPFMISNQGFGYEKFNGTPPSFPTMNTNLFDADACTDADDFNCAFGPAVAESLELANLDEGMGTLAMCQSTCLDIITKSADKGLLYEWACEYDKKTQTCAVKIGCSNGNKNIIEIAGRKECACPSVPGWDSYVLTQVPVPKFTPRPELGCWCVQEAAEKNAGTTSVLPNKGDAGYCGLFGSDTDPELELDDCERCLAYNQVWNADEKMCKYSTDGTIATLLGNSGCNIDSDCRSFLKLEHLPTCE
jgi:hypothetical protein